MEELNGEQKIYNDKGELVAIYTFQNNLMNGPATVFNNNQKYMEMTFKDNLMNGKLIIYNKLSGLHADINTSDGKKNGPFTTYYENGSGMQVGFYKDDQLHGEFFLYYPTGELMQHAFYIEGNLHGDWAQFKQNGSYQQKATYDHGKLVGDIIKY